MDCSNITFLSIGVPLSVKFVETLNTSMGFNAPIDCVGVAVSVGVEIGMGVDVGVIICELPLPVSYTHLTLPTILRV